MTYEFLKSLYADVTSMLGRLVVKRYDLAHKEETMETARSFELYRACSLGIATFYSFQEFDSDILYQVLDPATAVQVMKHGTKYIPEEYRQEIIRQQVPRIVERYEEKNNYYRMLMGLPDVEDRIPIYIKDHPTIDPTTPIQDLSVEQIAQLEIDGTLAELKVKYPSRKYLDYLGPNSIDLVTARLAKPFEILRLGPPSSNRTREMLETEYYKARRYVMANFYNPRMFPPSSRELYYPYLGLIITIMAVRNTLVPSEADYLNFEEILDSIFESYGLLKYFKRFPFTYKRSLVIALNRILANKGTDGVLVDICKVFNLFNFQANRYYLMKTYTKDIDGNLQLDQPLKTKYDLNFVKSDIQEHEIDYNVEDMLSYEEVTNSDYLWQLTDEETDKMLKEEFNLLMSKYISIEACFDVTYMTFEVCCLINLILYSRQNIQKINISNHYAASGITSIWTMLVFLLAAMAKKADFDGNIIYEPLEMAEIMRFNYSDIADEIKRITEKYELQIDVTDKTVPGYDTIKLTKPIGFTDGPDTVRIYVRNRNLYEAILQEMAITDDIRQYESLAQLKDLLFYSASERITFQKTDGTYANTYYEMLRDSDPSIANRLDELDDQDELNEMIIYILEKLEDVFGSNELDYLFLNTANHYNTIISRYLRTAINVFKASSVQLESIGIILYIGDHEPLRVIDNVHKHEDKYLNDTVWVLDDVATEKTVVLEDRIFIGDKVYTEYK